MASDERDGRAQRQLPAGADRHEGVADYLLVAYDPLCMHEFVLSGAPMKRELQIKTLDLAQRRLDEAIAARNPVVRQAMP